MKDLRGGVAMRQWSRSLACSLAVALCLGCASASPPSSGVAVPITDVRSLSGRWIGTMIDARNMGTPLQLEIGPDATYRMNFGATSAAGSIKLEQDGRAVFTMTAGSGLLGPADAVSTATLYDRGGTRALKANGRIGLRQVPFSWEATRQR
jgi:hypothetical protein